MPTTEPVPPESPDSSEKPDTPTQENDSLDTLLSRPLDQRVREYKYRFAQAAIFGLPVLALQYFGPLLGGPEAGKWVGLFQAILAGWVMYVGAAGMLFEGILLLRERLSLDLIIAFLALGLYLASVPSVIHALMHGAPRHAVWFHVSVVLVMLWTGVQWFRLTHRQ